MTGTAGDQLAALVREEWGRLTSLLLAQFRRLDLVEDALGDAVETATRRWPRDGVPQRPAAWLHTAARRRLVDRLRAEAMAQKKARLIAVDEQHRTTDHSAEDAAEKAAHPDDLLRLVLLCAHPALAPESGAALTLRLVLGISTADIARLFLVSEATMAARLTRAKRKVVAAGIPLALPEPDLSWEDGAKPGLPRGSKLGLQERLEAVAQVAYLAFTAGYAPGSGPDVVRTELAGEAIRLVRLVRASSDAAQGDPTLRALLALMLLQHSRRDARIDPEGEPVLLPDQDRGAWHRDEIVEGRDVLDGLTPDKSSGSIRLSSPLAASYLLQALIAAEHAHSLDSGKTNWAHIADLYAQLEALTGSPVVRLNHAVAVAEASGPKRGLEMLDDLDDKLPHSHRLPAVRGLLLARSGDAEGARTAYKTALERCDSEAEAAVLRRRIAELTD